MSKQFFQKHKQGILIALFVLAIVVIIGVITLPIFLNNSEVIKGEKYKPEKEYALLDLGGNGCSPCERLKPIIAELGEEYAETIDIKFYDITFTQEGAAIANAYNVSVMPTLLFLDKNGNELKRTYGFQTKEQIENIFKELGWIE